MIDEFRRARRRKHAARRRDPEPPAERRRREAQQREAEVQRVDAGVLFVRARVLGDDAELAAQRLLIRPRRLDRFLLRGQRLIAIENLA